ncbi:hypothetical protein L593_04630 [Salinarchaeum sp. Harcht-Bsk1]|uniref:DUF5798 family protein n=1 Tax=Salinarchaeum sp. Harcht-Bsk1 TaxID=1333523 RepID=UPI0003423BF4|nr:DUF5798 family protein [Salinarchaeum sp. Harcht-Bsk1]AGN00875.1 hypothetical protein L593_04630 [Salinarchaeum sp. Harcht-Bsk1]
MGLGGTAKKVQKLADTAETLYEQIKDLQRRMVNLEESVDESTARLDRLEKENEKQRLILEAIATEHDVDVESLLAESAIDEAEPVEEEAAAESAADADGTAAAADADSGSPDAGEPTVVDEQGNTVE